MGKIIELLKSKTTYMILACLMSVVFVLDINLTGVSLDIILVLAISLGLLMFSIISGQDIRLIFKPRYRRDIYILGLTLLAFIEMVVQIIFGGGRPSVRFSSAIISISFAVFYFIFRDNEIDFMNLIRVVSLGGTLPIIGILICFFVGFDRMPIMQPILNGDMLSAHIMLIAMLSSYLYIKEESQKLSKVYYLVALVSFVGLAFIHYVPGFWMLLLFLLLIPVLICPTAELIRRDAILIFSFVLLLSNIVLILDYSKLGEVLHIAENTYSLEHSVYLDLILTIAGYVFFRYWDRIPEDVDKSRIVLRRLSRCYAYASGAIGIVLGLFILGGSAWIVDTDTMLYEALSGFRDPLVDCIGAYRSGLWILAEKEGIIFTSLVLLFIINLIRDFCRKTSFRKPNKSFGLLMLIIFILELLCGGMIPQTVMTYGMILIVIINMDEKPLHISLDKYDDKSVKR